jgi:hypothetical protein
MWKIIGKDYKQTRINLFANDGFIIYVFGLWVVRAVINESSFKMDSEEDDRLEIDHQYRRNTDDDYD